MKKLIIIALVFTTVLFVAANTFAADDNGITYQTITSDEINYYFISSDGGVYKVYQCEEESCEDIPSEDLYSERIADNAVSVSCYYILKSDGTVWKWDNEQGKLNFIMSDVIKISASTSHLLAVKADGSLWGYGSNSYGELAQGILSYSTEEQTEHYWEWTWKGINLTVCTPDYFNEPIKIMDNVKSAVADIHSSCILKNDGTVWTIGDAYLLGSDRKIFKDNAPSKILNNVKSIYGAAQAYFAISDDGNNTLLFWGNLNTEAAGAPTIRPPVKFSDNIRYVSPHTSWHIYVVTISGELWKYYDYEDDAVISTPYRFFEDENNIREVNAAEPIKLAENINYTCGNPYEHFGIERELVLNSNRELYIMEEQPSGEYTFTKFKNNVRPINTAIIDAEYNDVGSLLNDQKKAVAGLSRAEIITGSGKNEFSPHKIMTRAETATVLLKMTAKSNEKAEHSFVDVTQDKWYYNTAGVSVKYGIINGYEDNTFRGDNAVTKLQLITLCARTLKNESFRKIDDAYLSTLSTDGVPDWAQNDVNLALQEGLISEQDLDNADEEISRADAAVILYRLYDKI